MLAAFSTTITHLVHLMLLLLPCNLVQMLLEHCLHHRLPTTGKSYILSVGGCLNYATMQPNIVAKTGKECFVIIVINC